MTLRDRLRRIGKGISGIFGGFAGLASGTIGGAIRFVIDGVKDSVNIMRGATPDSTGLPLPARILFGAVGVVGSIIIGPFVGAILGMFAGAERGLNKGFVGGLTTGWEVLKHGIDEYGRFRAAEIDGVPYKPPRAPSSKKTSHQEIELKDVSSTATSAVHREAKHASVLSADEAERKRIEVKAAADAHLARLAAEAEAKRAASLAAHAATTAAHATVAAPAHSHTAAAGASPALAATAPASPALAAAAPASPAIAATAPTSPAPAASAPVTHDISASVSSAVPEHKHSRTPSLLAPEKTALMVAKLKDWKVHSADATSRSVVTFAKGSAHFQVYPDRFSTQTADKNIFEAMAVAFKAANPGVKPSISTTDAAKGMWEKALKSAGYTPEEILGSISVKPMAAPAPLAAPVPVRPAGR